MISFIVPIWFLIVREDEEDGSDFDSEDSNAEGYYDRLCDAYGYGDEDGDNDGFDNNLENENEEDDGGFYYRRYQREEIVSNDFGDDWEDDYIYENEYYDGDRDDYGDYREEDYYYDDSW